MSTVNVFTRNERYIFLLKILHDVLRVENNMWFYRYRFLHDEEGEGVHLVITVRMSYQWILYIDYMYIEISSKASVIVSMWYFFIEGYHVKKLKTISEDCL
jgi:hypothetical protein